MGIVLGGVAPVGGHPREPQGAKAAVTILEAREITKAFPGVLALDRVDVAFEAGKIHGVVGENGAGKSTLVKILTGVLQPDSGRIVIDGQDARAHPHLFERVAYVPQELDLFWNLSVAENLLMPFKRAGIKGRVVRKRQLYEAAAPWLEKFQIQASPSEIVRSIPVSSQQLLQVARAVVTVGAGVLVLDEPTTSLTPRETEQLFKVLRRLRQEGKSIIFISHKVDELLELCDEITVLRNGVRVAHAPVREVDRRWIFRNMSGREIDEETSFRPRRPSLEVVLRVDGLSGMGFSDISFSLHRGEILGFAGLVGAGRSEIMQTIFGFLPATSGHVTLENEPLRLGETTESIRRGLMYLPEERRTQGILRLRSVRENIGVSVMRQIVSGLAIAPKKEEAVAAEIVRTYNIRTPDLERQIMYLSGGNQQKVIIGRAMHCRPRVLIFDEPTKGIDVATKVDIYRLMRELAEEQGVSILLVSSELDELFRCANRVVVIYRGKKQAEIDTQSADKASILASMFGE